MEATVAGRGAGAAQDRKRRAGERADAVPATELRQILENVMQAIESDDTASTLARATAPRLRLEVTDVELILNLAPSDEANRTLQWRFDDEIDWEPRLRLWADSATANRYLQGRESLAVAIARGRVRAEGDARAAMLYVPAMTFLIEPYRRLVRERFPDLQVD